MNLHSLTPYLEVFDLPAALAFYRDLLGFAVEIASGKTPETSGFCLLKLGSSMLMLNTAYDPAGPRPAAPDPARVKAHADTVLYFSCQSADEIYAHFARKNFPAEPPITQPYGMRQLHTQDPDGYGICFQHEV